MSHVNQTLQALKEGEPSFPEFDLHGPARAVCRVAASPSVDARNQS